MHWPKCRERFGLLLNTYLAYCGAPQRELCDMQNRLWAEDGIFAGICRKIQNNKGKGKAALKQLLHRELQSIRNTLPARHRLPIDPRLEVGRLVVDKCRVMSS